MLSIAALAIACAPQPFAPAHEPEPESEPEFEPEVEADDQLDEAREPSPAAEHRDWREARAAIIRGSPNPPEPYPAHEHALYSLLPKDPTPEQAQHEGEQHCARACTTPHARERIIARLADHEDPVIDLLRAGEPVQIGWTSTSPTVLTYAPLDHDLRNESLLYTMIHVIDGEGLVSQCLYRLGRDPSLTHERSCTPQERSDARSRRNPPPPSTP